MTPDDPAPAGDARPPDQPDPPLAPGQCRFVGTAASIHITGDHRVVLLEHARFAAPEAARVELAGVTVDQTSMARVAIDQPALLQPVNMNSNGTAYDVWYRTGPDRDSVHINITRGGGDTGGVRGDVPGLACADGCPLTWQHPGKDVTLYRAPDAPQFRKKLKLTGAFKPGKQTAVHKVEVLGARGSLTCRDDSSPDGALQRRALTEDQTQTWTVSADGRPALIVNPIEISGHTLHVRIENTEPPQLATPANDPGTQYTALVIGIALVAALIAIALWRRRDPIPDRPPEPRPEPAPDLGIIEPLSRDHKDTLVELLLACETVKKPKTRALIIDRLPGNISHSIAPSPESRRTHVVSIVATCSRFDRGITHLRDAVAYFEKDSLAMRAINQFLTGLTADASSDVPPDP